jgi:hypothetical protein
MTTSPPPGRRRFVQGLAAGGALAALGGWRVALARDVFVHHYGGASFGKLDPGKYLKLWWQNRRAFERKWQTRWQPR